MTSKIFKYELQMAQKRIALPPGAQVLSAGAQGNGIFIWVIQQPEKKPTEERMFFYFGTGWDVDESKLVEFIDTVHLENGGVYHVFEGKTE